MLGFLKKYLKVIMTFILPGIMLLTSGGMILAAPYQSYTYSYWGNVVPAPQAYLPRRIVTGRMLGVGHFNSPQDFFITDDNEIYVLDSGNNRIVGFDLELNVFLKINDFENNGQLDTFSRPQGIFVTPAGHIYVADTDNTRIVILDSDGSFIQELGPPAPEVEGIIPPDFRYRPNKVGVDPAGRIYVVDYDVYDGILEFDVDGNFRGFLGAPRVAPSLVDYFWRRVATQEQRARMSLFLPTSYSNIEIDERGFLYATVAGGQIVESEAIRRLNPTGTDVLRRTGFFPPVGDIVYPYQRADATIVGRSQLVDVTSQPHGVYSALDHRRGRVFTYDAQGNLLYVFGGRGDILGLFRSPVAVDHLPHSRELLVLDAGQARITYFAPTDYARHILGAIEAYNTGDYDGSALKWEKVLAYNANYDLAYSGIGRALLRQGDYYEAMRHFRLGNNRPGYSDAFALHRREVIGRHFGFIVTLLLVLFSVLYLGKKFTLFSRLSALLRSQGQSAASSVAGLKAGGYTSTLSCIKYALHLIIHPVGGFWDLKHEKRGNLPAAIVVFVMVIFTYVFMRQYTGFLFNPYDPTELQLILEITSVLTPFILWCIVNWSLTTLMDGKGTFKDIVIASAYALTPLVVVNIPLTVVSNFITLPEGSFYYLILVFAVVWSGMLLFLGTMTIHDYDLPKTAMTVFLIIVGMGTALFIGLLFFSLIDLMTGFMYDIYQEITLRM